MARGAFSAREGPRDCNDRGGVAVGVPGNQKSLRRCMGSKRKIAVVFIALGCLGVVLWLANPGKSSLTTYTYSQFLDQVRGGEVASVVVMGSNSGAADATYRLKSGESVRTVLPSEYGD